MTSVSVCWFVSLFVRTHVANITRPHFAKFSVMLPVAMARSPSDGSAICYVLPVSWMTSCFHYNRGNRPESKTTYAYVLSSSPGGGTVRDLRLHLLWFVYLCSTTSLTYHLQPKYVPMRYRFFRICSLPWIDLIDYLMIRSGCTKLSYLNLWSTNSVINAAVGGLSRNPPLSWRRCSAAELTGG